MRVTFRQHCHSCLIAVLIAQPGGVASAHHSGAQYDRSTIVEMEATVIRFEFRNPHAYIYVRDADGAEWTVEMNSAVRLRRDGWSANSLAGGDRITFRAVANRDPQKKRVRVRTLTANNGTVFDPSQQNAGATASDTWPAATSLEGVWGADPATFESIYETITDYPLTPKGQQARDTFDDSQDPVADCTSWPIPQLAVFSGLFPMKIELADKQVVFRYEFFNTVRTVYMDGRDHPTDAPRTVQGHSIGHWEDGTLVVDTRLFADHRSPFMFDGVASGAAKHVIERYRLSEDGTYMTASYFVEDPEYLAEPLAFDLKLRYRPDFKLQDNTCEPDVARRFLQ